VAPITLAGRLSGRHGLRVRWFDRWCSTLDDALQALPEMESCPHELFRLLMLNPSPTRKRAALVSDRDGPVSIIGLRRRKQYWQLVTQWITPDAFAPARAGSLVGALAALGVHVRIPGWQGPLPASRLVRDVTAVPVNKVDLKSDFQGYWRGSGQWDFIRKAQRRTEGFAFVVDGDGAAEWTIRRWADKWRDDEHEETVVASDLLVSAGYYQSMGQHHSFLLMDGETPVAGATCFVHGDELISGVFFREREYDRNGVGTRLIELLVEWAAAQGYAKLDLGGWDAYKARWGRQDGTEWWFSICPLPQRLAQEALWWSKGKFRIARGLWRRVAQNA